MGRHAWMVAVTLLAGGCDASPLTLGVWLRSDLDRAELGRVETVVRTADGADVLQESTYVLDAADSPRFGVQVATFELPAGDYDLRLRVDGLGSTRARRALVTVRTDRQVTIVMSEACDGVACPSAGDAVEATECIEGRCVPPSCLDPGSGCVPGCVDDTDCPEVDDVPCTESRCLSGRCAVVPDHALCAGDAVCHPERGCETGRCAEEETDCGDGADDDCDGRVDCLDEACIGDPCDDGDACTHTDVCIGDGACVGQPVICESDDCAERTCDGSDTCLVRPAAAGTSCGDEGNPCTLDECDGAGTCAHPPVDAGTTCPDDDNECTRDECDGAGRCAHPARPDGSPWSGGEFAACCGGEERHLDRRSDCGACGVVCPGGRSCVVVDFFDGVDPYPACECTVHEDCPTPEKCNGFIQFCSCIENGDCPAGTRCRVEPIPGTTNSFNTCGY